MLSTLFFSSAKQAGSSQVTFPHTPALPQALGLDPGDWGSWGCTRQPSGSYHRISFCLPWVVCIRWERGVKPGAVGRLQGGAELGEQSL